MHQIRVHLQSLGYPIANDPVYNLDQNADGSQGTPSEWTVDRAISKMSKKLSPDAEKGDDSDGIDWRTTDTYQAECTECNIWRPYPQESALYIYLHALHYKGPEWEFKTEEPFWASVDKTDTD
eukprot:m.121676 g.121676  ORF g.121676 m.121676 type:complete len:123 (-) comp14403_c0_seq3:115-483(-)